MGFFSKLKEIEEKVFSRVTISANDRRDMCNNLVEEFSNCLVVAMGDFEVCVIIIIIKNITREPIGKVISVLCGVVWVVVSGSSGLTHY